MTTATAPDTFFQECASEELAEIATCASAYAAARPEGSQARQTAESVAGKARAELERRLTRAEAACAHLASFQRGDIVDVGGRAFFLPGTVALPQQEDFSDINRAYLVVTGTATASDGNGGWRQEATEVKVTVGSLLAGKHTVTLKADAEAGRVRHFDAATWAMRNPEG